MFPTMVIIATQYLLQRALVFICKNCILRELGGHDADDEGQERQGALGARRAAGPTNRPQAIEGNAEDGVGAPGIVGAGQIVRRNAENVAARLEMQAARLEAHVEQMFDGLDDADGAEDVPFDELVGMQGHVFHLVENAITLTHAYEIARESPFTLNVGISLHPRGRTARNLSFLKSLHLHTWSVQRHQRSVQELEALGLVIRDPVLIRLSTLALKEKEAR
ncbi:hypothetical protein IEQ34_012400 [Dendrobium chrysotoxum]|uniref:RING-type E3 ubiquitin transferase n=1 Tax=Dendrobium chrysotoxum TaxID=161865 RepID=A0AAV7GSC4_DENCH|nr:hypothetical protein IEQ34_012400 [Dendrobium chrysotoxum]